MLEHLDTIVTIKLHNWSDSSLKQKFICHLESTPQVVTFLCVGNDLHLRYDADFYCKVFYEAWEDYARNKPIVQAGVDFEATREMTREAIENLNLKALIHLEGVF